MIFPGEFSIIFPFWETPKISHHRTDIEKLQVIQQHVGEACHRVATSAEAQRWQRGVAVSRDSGEVPRKVAICSWLFPKK